MLKALFVIGVSILTALISIFITIDINLANQFLKGRIQECNTRTNELKAQIAEIEENISYCVYNPKQLDISTVYEATIR